MFHFGSFHLSVMDVFLLLHLSSPEVINVAVPVSDFPSQNLLTKRK